MEMPKIPSFYNDVTTVFLIPSYTAFQSLQTSLKHKEIRLKTAPLIMDCYRPLYLDRQGKKQIFISGFIGADGIRYLTSLLALANLKKVFFVGSAASASRDGYKIHQVFFPSSYICQKSELDNLDKSSFYNFSLSNLWAHPEQTTSPVCSLRSPTFLMLLKIKLLKSQFEVELFDMEAAFIAEVCSNLGIFFGCALVVSDQISFGDKPKRFNKISEAAVIKDIFEKITAEVS